MAAISTALRVLIVDDEPLFCWSVAEMLRDAGDVGLEAGSGAAAIRALSAPGPGFDVVLLDYELPDSDDLRLLSTIKRAAPGASVILMSADCPADVADDALARGASSVVSKPFDMRDVAALVHGAVAGRAS